MEDYEIDESFVSESGQFDMTLIVDNHKIHVSKVVLCIASPVFRAMLESDFKDFKEKGQSEVHLPGKKYGDFVKFLGCFYPDRIESVTSKTVYGILPLAVEYQVKALEKRCHTFLIQLVKDKHVADAVEIYHHIQLSELYKLDDLKNISISIASEFCLAEITIAASKYPITEHSLVKIHHLARKREELHKQDDESLRSSGRTYDKASYKDFVRKEIESPKSQAIFRHGTGIEQIGNHDKLKAVRLWYRYFRNDEELLEKSIKRIKDDLKKVKDKIAGKSDAIPKEELDLLPEMIKRKLDLD